MAAQFYKINYKSDFVLTINSDAGWAVPFCIKFWTGMPSHGYFAGFDGENYVNCRVGETPTQLLVMFDDHHMPIGPLRMQIAYHTTIEEFPDRKFDEVTNPTNVTVDIDGTEYQVMLDFTGETGADIDFSMPSSGVMSVNGKIGYVTLNAEDVGAQPTIEDLATIRSGAAEGATAVQPAEMTAALATKQDTISDLATIRNGAAAGATAVQPATLQEGLATKQDTISDLATIRSGAAAGATAVQPAALQEGLATKQDVISDLSTIRSGAAAGATAVQPAALTPIESDIDAIEGKIPSAASTSNQLTDKAFVNSALADKADNSDIPTALSQLSQDSTHRVVTDAEKSTWNGKQNAIDDLATIRSGAAAGATAVQPAAMNAALATKQDAIDDLATIRSNAANAETNTGNKAYNVADFSGLGRVNLQKNIVEVSGTDKNVLTQAMVNTANTIYHIQYDYDLNGQTITLPAGCVLEFNGGSVKNGKLIGTFTITSQNICLYDVDITGATLKEVRSEWFNIQSGIDCTSILNNIVNVNTNNVVFNNYPFPLLVSAPSANDSDNQRSCVKITRGGRSIDFNGNTIQLIANGLDKYNIIELYANELELKNLNVVGDVSTHTGTTGGQGHGMKISVAHDIVIDNCTFNECWGDGIDVVERGDVYPYNVTFKNCKSLRNRRQGISIEGGRNLYFQNCEFAYTGTILTTSPSLGVDVEPWEDRESSKVIGVVFEDCLVHDNVGGEMSLLPCWHHEQEYDSEIHLIKCKLYNNSQRRDSLFAKCVHGIIIEDSIFGTDAYNSEASINNSQEPVVKNTIVYGCLHLDGTTNILVRDTQLLRCDANAINGRDGSGSASNCPLYTTQSYGVFNNCEIKSTYQTSVFLQNSNGNIIEFNDSKISLNVVYTHAIYLSAVYALFRNTDLSLMGSVTCYGLGQVKFQNCSIKCTANNLLSLFDGHNSNVDYDYIFENSTFEELNAVVYTNTIGKLGYFDKEGYDINYGNSPYNNYVILQRTHGTSAQRPVFTNGTFCGYKYYDEDINKTIFWNGAKWVDSEGYTAARSFGTNSQIPFNLGVSDAGFVYYSQESAEYLFWNGKYFVDQDGNIKGYAYNKDITADFEKGKYYKVTGSGTNMALSQTTSPDNRFSTILCNVHAGDMIKIIGVAGSSPRLYVLASGYNAGEVLEAEPANGTVQDDAFTRFVKVPSDCILVINCYNDKATPMYYNTAETPFSAVIYSNTAFE